jgi:hypothetical protein
MAAEDEKNPLWAAISTPLIWGMTPLALIIIGYAGDYMITGWVRAIGCEVRAKAATECVTVWKERDERTLRAITMIGALFVKSPDGALAGGLHALQGLFGGAKKKPEDTPAAAEDPALSSALASLQEVAEVTTDVAEHAPRVVSAVENPSIERISAAVLPLIGEFGLAAYPPRAIWEDDEDLEEAALRQGRSA